MSLWLNTTLGAACVLGTALLFVRCLRSRSAGLRHRVASAAFIAVIALPIAAFLLPSAAMPLPTLVELDRPLMRSETGLNAGSAGVVEAESASAATLPTLSIATLLFALWLAGALLIALLELVLRVRIRLLQRASTPIDDPDWSNELELARRRLGAPAVELRIGLDTPAPMTVGLARPRILLPADATTWSAERRGMVLAHELAHVRRLDTLWTSAAALATVLFWHVPWVWSLRRAQRALREEACDALVVARGTCRFDYARELVAFARGLPRQRPLEQCAVCLSRDELEGRVRALLSGPKASEPDALWTFAFALFVAVPIGALRFDPLVDATAGRLARTEAIARSADRSRYFELYAVRDDRSADVREAAVRAFGQLGCDPALLCVADALDDPHPSVRRAAAETLPRFGPIMARRSFGDVLDPLPASYSAPLRGELPVDATIIDLLRARDADEEAAVRRAAASSLRRLGTH